MARLSKRGTRSARDVAASEKCEAERQRALAAKREKRRREADARAAQKPVERQAADEKP